MFSAHALLGIAAVAMRPISEDEAKVPAYSLPPVLVATDGSTVTTSDQWRTVRRPEVMELFRHTVYGVTPAAPRPVRWAIAEESAEALDGLATRRQVRLSLTGDEMGPQLDLLIYLPNGRSAPVPAFLALNFDGNQSVDHDPAIALSAAWHSDRPDGSVVNNRATEQSRGSAQRRWPLREILERGYAVATADYCQIEPDHAEGWKTSLRAAMSPEGAETVWPSDGWGAIGAWAFGLSRCLDYLLTEPRVHRDRVIVQGHSRLGKTALWAGAQDQRFGMVISNNSGEGGAALTRRCFGETLAKITTAFPHWFCPEYAKYADREPDLPVDFHELLALVAPRPLYVASATEDKWADPKGEFLAAVAASPVYRLFGLEGTGTDAWPSPEQPVGQSIGYHLRSGTHDVLAYDWQRYMDFADRHWGTPPQ